MVHVCSNLFILIQYNATKYPSLVLSEKCSVCRSEQGVFTFVGMKKHPAKYWSQT